MSPTGIRFPAEFEPARCSVHVKNELEMAATPSRVWAWLIRAQGWPAWYINSAQVEFLKDPGPDLALDARFRWRTFGITITSTVREFVPVERIGWDATAFGVQAYHAWLIVPRGSGCYVLTEETQNGWVAHWGHALRPNNMWKFHQIWLESLAKQAEAGPPV